MFSIEFKDIDSQLSVQLQYKSEQCSFTFSPESIDMIKSNNQNMFNLRPYDGQYDFSYNEKHIHFNCGTFGDGFGGSLFLTIENTPETIQSLKDCLTLWEEKHQQHAC